MTVLLGMSRAVGCVPGYRSAVPIQPSAVPFMLLCTELDLTRTDRSIVLSVL